MKEKFGSAMKKFAVSLLQPVMVLAIGGLLIALSGVIPSFFSLEGDLNGQGNDHFFDHADPSAPFFGNAFSHKILSSILLFSHLSTV